MTAEDAFDELNRIAGPVSRETFAKLRLFEQEFIRWAGRINLTSAATLPHIWKRHILDSAQLVRFAPSACRWLDLGSGGGFPGAVICILLGGRGDVVLIESNKKKAAFLRTTLGTLGCRAQVHATRVEQLTASVLAPEVVTARALAPLPLLLTLASPWISGTARGLFHKGRDYRAEVQESLNDWHFDLLEHKSVVDPEGVILEVGNLRRIIRSVPA